MQVISLQHGAWRCTLRPDLGASLCGLWWSGRAIWRSTDAPLALQSPRESACFPMLPYSNRVAQRRFEWQGQTHELAPNFEGSPHSLHGVAWRRAWQVLEESASSCRLGLSHAPDADWPFAFEAEQQVSLDDSGLTLTLSLRNTDARAQPVGLGWHPYFVRHPDTQVAFRALGHWNSDATGLATEWVPRPELAGALSHLGPWDHCFAGVQSPIRLDGGGLALTLQTNCQHMVFFAPPGRDIVCLEPVSHGNGALNLPRPQDRGMCALGPGESFSVRSALVAQPASARFTETSSDVRP